MNLLCAPETGKTEHAPGAVFPLAGDLFSSENNKQLFCVELKLDSKIENHYRHKEFFNTVDGVSTSLLIPMCFWTIESHWHSDAASRAGGTKMQTGEQERAEYECSVVRENECCFSGFSEKRDGCFPGGCKAGTRLRVRGLRGCGRMVSRLCSLGFTPGTVITVLGSGSCGGCRVEVRDTCVVLDARATESIVCDPVL